MDNWFQVEPDEESEDVLARFRDGEHDITIVTVSNPDQQDEYKIPSVVQTSEDSAIVLVSSLGLAEMARFQIEMFSSMKEDEDRHLAAFATTMGMLLMLGVHKLADEKS